MQQRDAARTELMQAPEHHHRPGSPILDDRIVQSRGGGGWGQVLRPPRRPSCVMPCGQARGC